MSEKKEKKQDVKANSADIEAMAGVTALVNAIFAASEPEEIADVPGDETRAAAKGEASTATAIRSTSTSAPTTAMITPPRSAT